MTWNSGADLYALSNERASYHDGFEIAEYYVSLGAAFVRFSSGRTLRQGEEMGGGLRDDVWRAQIKHTIRRHLDKELDVRERVVRCCRCSLSTAWPTTATVTRPASRPRASSPRCSRLSWRRWRANRICGVRVAQRSR